MPQYIFDVQLNRHPRDIEVDALQQAADQAARVSQGERYAVLRYAREADTLSHAIAATIAEITQLPGLQAHWTEPLQLGGC